MRHTSFLFTKTAAIALAIAAVSFLTRCDSGPKGELEFYISQRDSLRHTIEALEKQVLKLDEIIAELDSTAEKMLVTTYHTSLSTFRHYFEVYGNVESDKAATLYPENPGLVQQILVREGDEVRKGQVLVRLDSEVLSKNVKELQTSLELANTIYDRQKRLWEQKIGSEIQYLEAKNRKESLDNSLATLQEQINKSSVRAPFDGIVDKVFPKIGEMASGQVPVARIVNSDNLYITADISERYISSLKPGDKVNVIVNRTDTIESKIARIGGYINPNNRTFEIRVELPKAIQTLKPNSLAILQINDYNHNDAVVLPSSLVMQDGEGRDYVYIARRNGSNGYVAQKQTVSTGMRYLGVTLILDGLAPEVEVIDKGSRSVRDGDRIQLVII